MISIKGFEKFLKDKHSYYNFDSILDIMKYYEEYYKQDYESEE